MTTHDNADPPEGWVPRRDLAQLAEWAERADTPPIPPNIAQGMGEN